MSLKTCENWFVLGLFLGVVGLISALALAFCARVTDQPIRQAQAQAFNKSLQLVLPAFDNNPTASPIQIDGLIFYGAKHNGKLVGVCAETEAYGYGSTPLKSLVGFNPESGAVTTMVVTANQETPGLGSQLCDRKEQKTIMNLFAPNSGKLPANHYLDQFSGKIAEDGKSWKVKKDGGDFDFITGATITSRAVAALADQAARVYIKNRQSINQQLNEVQ